jgi:hypothetical protein
VVIFNLGTFAIISVQFNKENFFPAAGIVGLKLLAFKTFKN